LFLLLPAGKQTEAAARNGCYGCYSRNTCYARYGFYKCYGCRGAFGLREPSAPLPHAGPSGAPPPLWARQS